MFDSVGSKNIEFHFDYEEMIRDVPLGFVGGNIASWVKKKFECENWSQLVLLPIYCHYGLWVLKDVTFRRRIKWYRTFRSQRLYLQTEEVKKLFFLVCWP